MKKNFIQHVTICLLFFISFKLFAQSNVFPPNGNVGIGTNNPQVKLDVFGKIVAGLSATSGDVVLEGRYGQGSPYGSLFSLGSLQSSGRSYWGFSVKPNPDPNRIAGQDYLSSTINPIGRAAIELGSGVIKFNTGGQQTSPDGSSVLMREALTITNSGIGIGTSSPNYNLEVAGTFGISLNGSYPRKLVTYTNMGYSAGYRAMMFGSESNLYYVSDGAVTIAFNYDPKINTDSNFIGNGSEIIFRRGTTFLTPNATDNGWNNNLFLQDGNVGIATTDTKGYKFAVNGSVIATKMVVKLNANWADFVFKPDYDLPKLETVAKFINKNGHLPNIPTEQEVEKDGIDLGSMNTKLLQKVEELTLYLIEMKKEVDKLKKEVAELKKGK